MRDIKNEKSLIFEIENFFKTRDPLVDDMILDSISRERPLVFIPKDLAISLSLKFNIDFSIKADYENKTWILSSNTRLDKDTTLKVFEYIYNRKCGLWSVDVSNTFEDMSYGEYCRQIHELENNDMKNIENESKEASQNIMSQFNKLKDKRKKAEAKLIKANNKMKEFALKYEIENYYK